jgi:hypothetical protein
VSLRSTDRRTIVAGISWFVVAMTPTFAIVGSYASYYLFLPSVGLALVVGTTLRRTADSIRTKRPALALLIVALPLGIGATAARTTVIQGASRDTSLAFAGRLAESTLIALERDGVQVPAGSMIFFLNDDLPDLWRYHGIGTLFKLVYDDSVEVLYSSLGHVPSPESIESRRLIAIEYVDGGGFRDVTAEYLENPSSLRDILLETDLEFTDSDLALHVTPEEIVAGSGSYTISVPRAPSEVEVLYRIDDGPLARIPVRLDPSGRTRYFVSSQTVRGRYRFVAFRPRGMERWIRSDASILIR